MGGDKGDPQAATAMGQWACAERQVQVQLQVELDNGCWVGAYFGTFIGSTY